MFKFLTKAAEGLHLTSAGTQTEKAKPEQPARLPEAQTKAKEGRLDPEKRKEARRGLMIF
jgi:hypothetical protein